MNMPTPDAGYGFDSDLGQYYYDQTLYLHGVHNREAKVDLPINFMIEPAKEHDSILAIKALSQTRELYPDAKISYYCLDSASDNEAAFQLCLDWGNTPVIDLNARRGKDRKSGSITISSMGIPTCMASVEMYLTGLDKTHNAYKYRCPLVMKKISECPHRESCSRTNYGRTFYMKCGSVCENRTEI